MSRLLPFALLFWVLCPPASAGLLLIEAMQQAPANNAQGLLRPSRGQSMSTVETRFGRPNAVNGPIGDPPISRWDYPGYSVYFEYDRVLDTVVHRP